MNKAEIVAKISDEVGVSKSEVNKVIDSLFQKIGKSLKKGDPVTFVGFGTFKTIRRKSRKGRNPRTGAAITIPAAKVPKFTPGKTFKDSIR
ncbi:MAG: HU family DNA-binding protein [Nitrospira sp.]|nr:HU family DNA-binding protein [Nitrospira sp.]